MKRRGFLTKLELGIVAAPSAVKGVETQIQLKDKELLRDTSRPSLQGINYQPERSVLEIRTTDRLSIGDIVKIDDEGYAALCGRRENPFGVVMEEPDQLTTVLVNRCF